MDLKFIEATQNLHGGFNYGKFAIGMLTQEEWLEPARLAALPSSRLLGVCGWHPSTIWVMDLQTGEAAMFTPGGLAAADLNKKRIWVCVLFEPFLGWLYALIKDKPETWWGELPRVLELPGAPDGFYSYRRPGPEAP